MSQCSRTNSKIKWWVPALLQAMAGLAFLTSGLLSSRPIFGIVGGTLWLLVAALTVWRRAPRRTALKIRPSV
jgi:hypothetical protein